MVDAATGVFGTGFLALPNNFLCLIARARRNVLPDLGVRVPALSWNILEGKSKRFVSFA